MLTDADMYTCNARVRVCVRACVQAMRLQDSAEASDAEKLSASVDTLAQVRFLGAS